MGQAISACPGCTICCATYCCGWCVATPDGLKREVTKHRDVFRAIGLRHEQLVVLWLKFQTFDQDVSGNLELGEFLQGIGLSGNIFATRAFEVLDDEVTGVLKFHEFCRALVVYCTLDKAALSLFAFDVFDFDGDGVLSGPDVQRALLEVYGTSSDGAANTRRLLDRAKTLAHRHASGKAARIAEGTHFALDRPSFDIFVREVPSLCFPVFTVQRRLWEACGGQGFWRRITKERQERAKHGLRHAPGGGATYEYKDWRGLVADIGSPTKRQQESLKKLGLTTPTPVSAVAGGSGASKGRRHSAFAFSGGGAAPGQAGNSRREAGVEAAFGPGKGSVLRQARNRRASEAAAATASSLGPSEGAAAGPSGDHDGAEEGGGDDDDDDTKDVTDVGRGLSRLTKHEIATVSVFGSAAERRAAAAALGGVSKKAKKEQAKRRQSLAAENLEAIRALTGTDAYEAEHYAKMNRVGRQASQKAAANRRRSMEASARRSAAGAGPRARRASVATAGASHRPGGAAGRRPSLSVDTGAQRPSKRGSAVSGTPSGLFASPAGQPAKVAGGVTRGRRSSAVAASTASRGSRAAAARASFASPARVGVSPTTGLGF